MRLRGFQLALFAAALTAALGCGGVGNKADDPQYVTVCTEQAVTGTHIGRMRCHRKIDEQERERRDRAFMQHILNETNRAKKADLLLSALRSLGGARASHGQNQKR